jgi:hypothetical protein
VSTLVLLENIDILLQINLLKIFTSIFIKLIEEGRAKGREGKGRGKGECSG